MTTTQSVTAAPYRPSRTMVAFRTAFQSRLGRFATVLVVNFVVAMAIAVAALGYNPYTGSVDFSGGMAQMAQPFGGLGSLGTIGLALALLGLAAYLFNKMASYNYQPGEERKKMLHVGLAVLALAIAAISGARWINVPDQSVWLVAGFVVMIVVQTIIARWRFHR